MRGLIEVDDRLHSSIPSTACDVSTRLTSLGAAPHKLVQLVPNLTQKLVELVALPSVKIAVRHLSDRMDGQRSRDLIHPFQGWAFQASLKRTDIGAAAYTIQRLLRNTSQLPGSSKSTRAAGTHSWVSSKRGSTRQSQSHTRSPVDQTAQQDRREPPRVSRRLHSLREWSPCGSQRDFPRRSGSVLYAWCSSIVARTNRSGLP